MQVVRFPDDTEVRAGGIADRDDRPVDLGLYLDPRWSEAPNGILLECPDFGVPKDEAGACKAIREAFRAARAGRVVEVGCRGGLGRTGTVLACMAVLAGVEGTGAVAWVRRHYRSDAVETDEQEAFVGRFATFVA